MLCKLQKCRVSPSMRSVRERRRFDGDGEIGLRTSTVRKLSWQNMAVSGLGCRRGPIRGENVNQGPKQRRSRTQASAHSSSQPTQVLFSRCRPAVTVTAGHSVAFLRFSAVHFPLCFVAASSGPLTRRRWPFSLASSFPFRTTANVKSVFSIYPRIDY